MQKDITEEKGMQAAGIVLGVSIVVAMALANSPLAADYFRLFGLKVGFVFDGEPYLYHSLHHWINDGLMSLFFFVVGLELKREFIGGELSHVRNVPSRWPYSTPWATVCRWRPRCSLPRWPSSTTSGRWW